MDIKMDDMLSHLSGVHYFVSEDDPRGDGKSCVGGLPLQRLEDQDEMGLAFLAPIATATVSTVQATAGQLATSMAKGTLQQFFSNIVTNISRALTTLIKGRTYTTGGYQLGEMFMRNILGMQEIQSNWDVPDDYVPLAEQFFTLALGLEIGADDHMNELLKSADAYYAWMPPEVDAATPRPVAERAHRILKKMNYGWPIRDATWNLEWFAAEPYIYPIPDVIPGTFFTGTHPITGEEIIDGYPVKKPVLPSPVELPTADINDTIEPGEQSEQKPDEPKPMLAGMNMLGMLLIGGLAVGLVMSSKKRK